jgi:hypothetical protein
MYWQSLFSQKPLILLSKVVQARLLRMGVAVVAIKHCSSDDVI